MTRRSRMPALQKARAVTPAGWGALTPVAALCVVALAAALVAFGGRGGAETRSSAACLTDAAPGRFESWDAFFRRYPFDDAFVKSRIKSANGDAPGGVIVVPLEAGVSCGKASSGD